MSDDEDGHWEWGRIPAEYLESFERDLKDTDRYEGTHSVTGETVVVYTFGDQDPEDAYNAGQIIED